MNSEAANNFVSITGASPEQAKFFLESAGGDLSAAIDSFFESSGAGMDDESKEVPPPPIATSTAPPIRNTPKAAAGGVVSRGRGHGGNSGNIRGFSDLRSTAHDDEDSDDGPNEYYTGGEKSGMMVQDPKNRREGNDDIEALFEKARQSGAQAVDPEDMSQMGQSQPSAFSGASRTLAGGDSAQGESTTPAASNQPPIPVLHTVTFWNNGFTVDDGPLRKQDDPANKPFLQSIELGECPHELEPSDRKTPVHVSLMRKTEDYTPPPVPKYIAFSGGGRTLGSSANPTLTSAAPIPPSGHHAGGKVAGELVVDEGSPTTSLQLRLHDGTRLLARFNLTHTVGDIRRFISHARPDTPRAKIGRVFLQDSYQLMTSFPPKQLSTPTDTIEAAGLVGAVVIQKL